MKTALLSALLWLGMITSIQGQSFVSFPLEHHQSADTIHSWSPGNGWQLVARNQYERYGCDSVVRSSQEFFPGSPSPYRHWYAISYLNPDTCSVYDSTLVYDTNGVFQNGSYRYWEGDTLVTESSWYKTRVVNTPTLSVEEQYSWIGQAMSYLLSSRIETRTYPGVIERRHYRAQEPGDPLEFTELYEIIGDSVSYAYQIDPNGFGTLVSEGRWKRDTVGNKVTLTNWSKLPQDSVFTPSSRFVTYDRGLSFFDSMYFHIWNLDSANWVLVDETRIYGLTETRLDSAVNLRYHFITGMISGGTRMLVHYDSTTTAPPASVAELDDANELIVYPNPARDQVHIRSDQPIQQVEVVNLMGARVLQQRDSGSFTSVNLDQVSPGLYFLRIQLDAGEYIRQVVVE